MMCVWAECRIPSIRANGGATAWLVGGLWACGRLVGGVGGCGASCFWGDGSVEGARLDRAVLAFEEALNLVLAAWEGLKFAPRALRAAKICVACSARDR